MTCTCDDEDAFSCPVHVSCDENCQALNEPETVEELRAALDHWQSHGYLHGCSHAC